MKILLVEDDAMIGEAVRDTLKEAAYAVDWVKNGPDAVSSAGCQHYDVILLDLGLPGQDGLSVLSVIRQKGIEIPVLILTARDALEDRLKGLDSGADDYVLKPFDMSELLARIRAILRRKGGSATPVLTNGILALDPASHEAKVVSDNTVCRLSNREFSLLNALMLRPGRILSRGDLEERIYGWGEEVESNAVEFLIHALRKKLGNHVIKNVRGVGWMVLKEG
ncbi:response regulator transcription factor [Yersinia intermedia]|uniref:response regulator n=1 Tax=Yersinia intermedia TaxID=631 RepID=UPI000B729A75|nr:response regulator transcription factor [Yersinia intermedia]MCW8114233.1 response regulator transcription factor [Yersinia intermedia]MDA5518998.1 response regulator transcription factor [Yersinia intermedia]OWF90385.1 DNA-binding response regulator [Yersinia intermedia]